MKLADDDRLDQVFLVGGSESPTEAVISKKKVALTKLHIGNRDTKGTKLRT